MPLSRGLAALFLLLPLTIASASESPASRVEAVVDTLHDVVLCVREGQGEARVLLRTDTQAGHGQGKPTDKVIAEIADEWSFLCSQLGVE